MPIRGGERARRAGPAGAWLVVLAGAAAILLPSCSGEPTAGTPELPRVRIAGHTWRVDLAMTRRARYRGLSGRTSLGRDEGMLFVYPEPQEMTFCMRQCLIPLDVAFIAADLRVLRMHTMRVEPDFAGRTHYDSHGPAQYALEVRGGALAAAGVAVGDKVELLGSVPDAAKAEPGP